ncbi:hypothetical protein C0993_004747 [Termitomyces sp. T159_Od127]|nr:hypothetical protein C0993_004747 [Termitomyces sp. T159_Od127]
MIKYSHRLVCIDRGKVGLSNSAGFEKSACCLLPSRSGGISISVVERPVAVLLCLFFLPTGTLTGCPSATLSTHFNRASSLSAWDPAARLAKQSWRDALFILMTASVGSLGLMSLRNPFSELVGVIFGKTDFRTLFCIVVIFIVVFVLAYLTNPSENSFRAYLTEQSFRLHLSRLDDNTDDDHKQSTHRAAFPAARTHHTYENASTFHFANKAAISLKTPKHVFHSFGIFTIAAMVPLARSGSCNPERESSSILSDSWYIGAFGRWWRGGVIEAWYHDVIARTKAEESWSSGILSMKNLDRHNEYNGLPFSTKNLPAHLLTRGSPPKLRSREKSAQKPAMPQARSSTPPPLPKSASLPLHTARLPPPAPDRPSNPPQPGISVHTCVPPDQARLGSPLQSRSPSTLFDQSPRIAEVLRQITHAKTAVRDLRAQLGDCQSCAAQSHGALQSELDAFRDRKRQEDAVKLETKSRTKFLEDSRRGTEALKKDAEKKMKAAQSARDSATQRMEFLDKEIAGLRIRLAEDEALVHQETVSETEKEIKEALEHKRREIKVAEDVVAALNQRARELEERLAEHKLTLASIKERNQARLIETNRAPAHEAVWTHSGDPASDSIHSSHESHASPAMFDAENALGRRSSITVDTQLQHLQAPFDSSPTNASKEKSKKGLNPDAKVFSITHKPSFPQTFAAPSPAFSISPPSHAFDALNPTGMSATIPAPSPGCFTRAFAPSPAEREALQRALGGSTNTSFERLPSLSDVGSIPSSPSHVHARPAAIPQHALAKVLPAWLQSLPPHKATNFSPWDDEEPGPPGGSGRSAARQK